MEKASTQFHLPKILLKASLSERSELKKAKSSSRPSLQNFLQEIRFQQLSFKKRAEDRREGGYKKMEKSNELYKQVSRRQVKKFEEREKFSLSQEEEILEEENVMVSVYKHDTTWKPPHRYSTANNILETAIAFNQGQILVYGGFGPQKYLSLARFSLKNQDWSIPKIQDKSSLALYSHTMAAFRGSLYIYGGIKMDSPTNELLLINLKTSEMAQLPSAPYRRRDHAMTFANRFLTIQGGIQGQNEVKSTLFYFDTEVGKWTVPQQYQIPSLSHHSIVAVPMKTRRKQCTFQEAIGDALYIFGGRNEREVSSNRLYKLRTRQSGDITTDQIFSKGMPYPRHSACVQFIGPFYICIFGGRSDEEFSAENIEKGIFNDLFLFHIDKKEWIAPTVNLELPYRYGASCCVSRNSFFIFGGNEIEGYSDGNVIELVVGKEVEEEDEENGFKKGKLRG